MGGLLGLAVRKVRKDEEDAYLALLCRAFGLNLGQSALAFYSDPLFSRRERWALFDGRELIGSVSTLEMTFGRGGVTGISNVAIQPERRGQGLAQRMLEHVLDQVGPACLFANQPDLYQRLGFKVVDEVIRGTLPTRDHGGVLEKVNASAARDVYRRWSSEDNRRLVRDDARWTYWTWAKGVAFALGNGYVKLDSGSTREIIASKDGFPLDLSGTVDWIGLREVTRDMDIPVENGQFELLFMTWGIDWVPRMFLTDQF